MCVESFVMKILAINQLNNLFQTPQAEEPSEQRVLPKFGLVMASPLTKDTVSFKATAKVLKSRADGVSKHTAMKFRKEAEANYERVIQYIDNLFGKLVATDMTPSNPIEALKWRLKMPDSIVEKSATREWQSKDELFENMTDLYGTKIVMRDGSKKAVRKILQIFKTEIEKDRLRLVEIENKRPMIAAKMHGHDAEKWDYASEQVLDDIYNTAVAKKRNIIKYTPNDYTETNYPGLHFLFRFPGQKWCFELQLMGHDVAVFKDMDDIIYKILGNKNVNPKFKEFADIIEPLKEPGNAKILDKFNAYRAEAFLFQRDKEPTTFRRTGNEYFLPLRYDIPQELDFNNLYQVFLKCCNK